MFDFSKNTDVSFLAFTPSMDFPSYNNTRMLNETCSETLEKKISDMKFSQAEEIAKTVISALDDKVFQFNGEVTDARYVTERELKLEIKNTHPRADWSGNVYFAIVTINRRENITPVD